MWEVQRALQGDSSASALQFLPKQLIDTSISVLRTMRMQCPHSLLVRLLETETHSLCICHCFLLQASGANTLKCVAVCSLENSDHHTPACMHEHSACMSSNNANPSAAATAGLRRMPYMKDACSSCSHCRSSLHPCSRTRARTSCMAQHSPGRYAWHVQPYVGPGSCSAAPCCDKHAGAMF